MWFIRIIFYILVLFSAPAIYSAQKSLKKSDELIIPLRAQFPSASAKSSVSFLDIPTDVLRIIATFLEDKEICKFRLICTDLNSRFSHANFNQQVLPFPTIRVTDRTLDLGKRFMLFKKMLIQLQKGRMPLVPHKFDFSSTSITDKKLTSLFCIAPHIKKLSINSCFELKYPDWNSLYIAFDSRPHNQVKQLSLLNCSAVLIKNIPWIFFSNLKALNVGQTDIGDQKLNEIIKCCPNITALGLKMCTELNFKKTPWEALTNLRAIDFTGDSINDTTLRPVPALCVNLKELKINSCYAVALSHFVWNCKDLSVLKALSTDISCHELERILGTCNYLKNVNFSQCPRVGFNILAKKNLALIKRINVGSTNITDDQLENILKNSPFLLKLHLYGCDLLKFKGNLSWCKVPFLTDLNVGATAINDKQLEKIFTHCKRLVKLKLNSCKKISTTSLEGKNSLDLKTLLLDDTLVFDGSLNKIFHRVPVLEDLSLCICEALLFKSIKWERASSIKRLNLWGTKISDTGLADILNNLPLLEDLTLHECTGLRASGLPWNKVKHLKTVALNCTAITEKGLREILNSCPELKKVSVFYCEKLHRSSKLLHQYPHVDFRYW
ncbi:TPA: hypothetical protein DDZ86_01790 [Candidatus Dependentiae bacterium]|nr:MAG: hypothetical protein UW09_C0001G0279 [candidate division TM6 bacterium GW2011_GWF2_43_87]HBL98356.1 hypothetical protein [Candidatus Dependentiae bacterium]